MINSGDNAYLINQKLLDIRDVTEDNIVFNNLIQHDNSIIIKKDIRNPATFIWENDSIKQKEYNLELPEGFDSSRQYYFYSKNLQKINSSEFYIYLLSPNKTNFLLKKIQLDTNELSKWNINLTITVGEGNNVKIGYHSNENYKYYQKDYRYPSYMPGSATYFSLYKNIVFPNDFEDSGFSSLNYEYKNKRTYYEDEDSIAHYFRTPVFPGYWIHNNENQFDYPIIYSIKDTSEFTSFQGNEINQTNKIFLDNNHQIVFGKVTSDMLKELPHCTIFSYLNTESEGDN